VEQFSRRSSLSSRRSSLVNPSRLPASISACFTHSRTAVSVRSKSRATWPIVWSPTWHRSTISALNSGVNYLRGRGFFFAIVSIVGILSGASPLKVDVRQTGAGPIFEQMTGTP
jgi:hypothetical protein